MSAERSRFRMTWWSVPRRRWLTILVAAFSVCALGYGAYWARDLRYTEYTDDAYVDGHVIEITPQISGTVVALDADDTQYVVAGEPLVQLDPADATVALQRSEAELAQTVRRVRNLFATTAALEADVNVRRTELTKGESDYARRVRLVRSGAISQEELQHASDAVRAARAALAAAEQQLAANRAWVDGTTIGTNPDVRAAATAVHAAYLTSVRTVLPAPVSGFVAKRNVQLGERVSPGLPLMSVVPLAQVWVDANFKESQLRDVRTGQPVTLISDLYGSGVVFHGQVVGFGAGTGSAFALLPAQNATGNWIKIVQRVPVRIALDPRELAAHPLEVGLSMKAYIDVRNDGGARLPEVASQAPDASTDVFSSADRQAAGLVQRIIAENDPAAARASPARQLADTRP
ncbi:MAG: HlyD family efflux transporter periplasmic adaptor subunit [Steroidobacteraceae bacterium]